MEEHIRVLWVFENRVLTRTFAPKIDEMTESWIKLHNEKLHELYSSSSIIKIVKPWMMGWEGYCHNGIL